MLNQLLDNKSELQEYLYCRGFLITDSSTINSDVYPFYSNWNKFIINKYHVFVHNKQHYYFLKSDNYYFLLIGHAYNPFDMKHSENDIIENLAELYKKSTNEFFDKINELTGIYTFFIFDSENNISFFNDAAGMQVTFYGMNNGNLYISTHSKLIGDLCCLEMSPYVKELISYKYYKLFGKMLPGDISPYENFKRVIPNFSISFSPKNGDFNVKRFALNENKYKNLSYDEIVEKISKIMHNNLSLITNKWEHPAISLTGGCDSKTSLSCANGLYDKYLYFSYDSSDEEKADADAAKKICDLLDSKHKLYYISRNDDDFAELETIKKILYYNSGCIGKDNANDIRKRIFFMNNNDFDVEVKSWVSEIGRAYYHKRFSKNKFPKKPSPRYLSALYKVFLGNRKLLRQTDKIFENYLDKYCSDGVFDKYAWYDVIFWEYRVGTWNGLVITGEHKIAFDITIPYNNRNLLLLFLAAPLQKRINDTVHKDVMKFMNNKIYSSNISVTNVKHTNLRTKYERLYLEIQSRLPF